MKDNIKAISDISSACGKGNPMWVENDVCVCGGGTLPNSSGAEGNLQLS